MLSIVPFGAAYYSYATYLESEKISSAEISRLAAYDRDRNIIGEDKIKNALADSKTTCFLDIDINGEAVGRLEIALFDSVVPITSKNFQLLCENKCKPTEGKQTSVRSKGFTVDKAKFFRVVPGFCAQCGMEPLSGNAANISAWD